MVLLEDLGRALQVERLVSPLAPRQLRHGLQVCSDYLGLHRVAVRPFEPLELALHLLARRLGKLQPRQPLAKLLDLAALVLLAQLLPDRLQLLAQQHLALPLAQLLLDLRLDLLLSVEDADLALHLNEHAPQALLDRQDLEQCLALGGLHVEVARHEVGEPTGISDSLQDLLHHVFG